MSVAELGRRYWRIPAVALLAGVLAFAASFVLAPTYTSSSRLLIHGRDATFLTSTGKDLSGQPGVVDASLSQTLLSTYAGIATSRTVAVTVVDQLALDQPAASTAFYAPLVKGLGKAYRCTAAFLTSGFCAPVDRHEQAVLEVQRGISAAPVGTNGGATSGQDTSYVLDVTTTGRTPEQAQAIANTVADRLVSSSSDRATGDADAQVTKLQAQVDQAQTDLTSKQRKVADYQTRYGITAGDAKQTLSAATLEQLKADLLAAKADQADTEAQVTSVRASIAQIPRSQQSTQRTTSTDASDKDSTSRTSTSTSNSAYNDLLVQLNTLEAQQSGYDARVKRLQSQIGDAKLVGLNGPLAKLAGLQESADLATENLRTLSAALQTARSTAAQGSADLSRLDDASRPTYPTTPKRYVYLALGLLLGALAGAGLTGRTRRRETGPPSTMPPALTAGEAQPQIEYLDLVGTNGRTIRRIEAAEVFDLGAGEAVVTTMVNGTVVPRAGSHRNGTHGANGASSSAERSPGPP